MVFNSLSFWVVFPFVFLLYWLVPGKFHRIRNTFLVFVSYLLYMNWNPGFAIVLLWVTIITYYGALLIDLGIKGNGSDGTRKLLCVCFAFMGLFPLLVFKYYNFINDSITSVLQFLGLHFALSGLNWAIPVGISFFTFQAVGYLLDVYNKRINVERNFLEYTLFVCFFPQITSGPISTAKELMPQIKTAHVFDYEKGVVGLRELLWGMFLKCVVADRLGLHVDLVYSNYEYFSGFMCLRASFLYTMQIYCDFSGYSLMAIGIAKTLGFDLINNFNRPYLAASITDFWKRWHISLTRWLTIHVYINLGGNRCNKRHQYRNILITFLVSGLWHGANWTFIIWGAMHGFFQIVEKELGIDPKGRHYQYIESIRFLLPFRIMITFALVSIAWIFFRMPTISDSVSFLGRIVACVPGRYEPIEFGTVVFGSLFLLLLIELLTEFYSSVFDRIKRLQILRWSLYILLFVLILSFGVLDAGQFIYVSF